MTQPSGLLESLKRLTGTLLAIAQTRLALLSNELEEERLRIRQMFFFGSIALFFFAMFIMLLTVFVVVLFWDSYRLLVLGGMATVFFIAGLLALIALRRAARERTRLFSFSIAELSDDIDRLTPRS